MPSLGILPGASLRVEFAEALLSSIVLGQEEESSVQHEVCYQKRNLYDRYVQKEPLFYVL